MSATKYAARGSAFAWKVNGMDCASCASKIRSAVERMPGVDDVKLSIASETLSLVLDEERTGAQAVEDRVKSLGYGVSRVAAPRAKEAAPAPQPAAAAATPSALSWKVSGMDCASCAAKIRTAIERLPGVADIKVSVMNETLSLRLDEAQSSRAEIEKRVSSLGYSVTPQGGGAPAAQKGAARADDDHAGCGHDHDHKDHDHKGHNHKGHDHAGHDHDHAGHDHKGHDHAGHDHDHAGHDHKGHDHAGHAHDHAGHDHGGPTKQARGAAAAEDHGHGLPGHVHEKTPAGASWWQTGKGRLVLGTGALLAAAWLVKLLANEQVAYWGFVVACVIGVAPVARRAFAAARAGVPFTIEMLMTIAAAGALVIGAAEEAALVVFLFAVGEVLEGVAADRARASIRALADLVPKTAWIEENGETRQVDASTLSIGQVILARPGDRISADGEILSGTSGVDEAPVTGESVPKTKTVGDAVFAGSINKEAALRVKVTRAAEDNTIARIIRLVEEAQEARAPTERFIDRFSRIYMPAIVILAILVAVIPPLAMGGEWQTWIYRALALLLIGCPCALVISVPASIASSLSAGARRGLLLKGGAVIEAGARTTVVAFDKTGTLTVGKPTVTDVQGIGVDAREALALAAAVEAASNHPLAEAIIAKAKADGVAAPVATDGRAIPGRGVEALVNGEKIFVGSPRFAAEIGNLDAVAKAAADILEEQGKTVAAVFRTGQAIGLIALRDEPREDAKEAVAQLKTLGVRSIMLTGDNARTGAAIAGGLGMDHRAELLPDDKVAAIKELTADDSVMMIGDGINDAPALAAATVGVAMGSGTDVAIETADGALLRSRVLDVPRLIRLARGTMVNIRQNIVIALGLKAVFLVTSVLGLTGLWIAILADTGATVIVTMNALRLLAFNPDDPRQS